MTQLTDLFTDIANSIRTKKGTSQPINAVDFPNEIDSIQTGGSTPKYGIVLMPAVTGSFPLRKLSPSQTINVQTTNNWKFTLVPDIDNSSWYFQSNSTAQNGQIYIHNFATGTRTLRNVNWTNDAKTSQPTGYIYSSDRAEGCLILYYPYSMQGGLQTNIATLFSTLNITKEAWQ